LGFIGHYAARDGAAAASLLPHACEQLARAGCTRALAPIDGSTWRNYRFVTHQGDEPRFLLEPDHPSDWPDHFLAHGFQPWAKYFSALNANLAYEETALARVAARLAARGVTVRPMDIHRFDEELRAILEIARVAFRNHLLYDDIDEAEARDQYRRLRAVTGVDLTLIAEHQVRPVGFVFAAPDLLQQRRGEKVDTMIVKTLGVLPRHELAGLGQHLLASVHRQGLRLGYRRAVYALVYDSLPLRRLSGRYAQAIREYALFGKALEA
jgi:GNAT superfamily N-acetyltransferase